MKYWAYLAAKLAGVAGMFFVLMKLTAQFFSHRYMIGKGDPFAHDLPYTFAVMLVFLTVVGSAYLAIWDQRYRCRTCLRRLRMPIAEGGWHKVLFAPPRRDYICLYGHGTLRVPDLKEVNRDGMNWEEHDDMWKELFALHDSEK
jgi:hypothetical protein